ncbi:hypothetical protein HDU98_008077 [Podochytrium sp. JEL0797]|nr:hypothetical protein HDU98_008077 [Podochytrium sp. JEL0797]
MLSYQRRAQQPPNSHSDAPPSQLDQLMKATEEFKAELADTWAQIQGLKARLALLDLKPVMNRLEDASLDMAFVANPVKLERIDPSEGGSKAMEDGAVCEITE